MASIKDEDGTIVKAGDIVHFSYGIPPVGVDAKVIDRDGGLICLTPGHNPPECTLKWLKKEIVNFYIVKPKRAKMHSYGD